MSHKTRNTLEEYYSMIPIQTHVVKYFIVQNKEKIKKRGERHREAERERARYNGQISNVIMKFLPKVA